MAWLDEYAAALSREGDTDVSLSPDEMATILRLAREVAHRTERRFAPVSTFLAGRFVAERIRRGADGRAAAEEALRIAAALLPPPAEE